MPPRPGQEVGPEVAGRDDVDRKGQHARRHQPGEVAVDRLRLPAGVGEDGTVGHRTDGAVGGHQGQGGGLDAGAEAEDAQPDCLHRRLGRRAP